MAIPATSGMLRTKVEDMEIGDYIACKVTTAGTASTDSFYDLGETVSNEVPYGGLVYTTKTLTGTFYFVKVDRGVLVADRPVLNTISWDALNESKLIQGTNFGINIVPLMTSNVSSQGTLSADTSNGEDYPFKAFDRGTNASRSFWYSRSTVPVEGRHWIQYVPTTLQGITAFTLTSDPISGSLYGIKDFQLMGISQSGEKTVLYEGTHPNNGLKQYYFLPKRQAHYSYRLYANSYYDSNTVLIKEMELLSFYCNLRSLTGGVAFANLNGNMSVASQNNGAWPQNNEWDKYIVNSSLNNKISPNSPDVWHHNEPIVNWCQDTPILGMIHPSGGAPSPSSNIGRVHRGINNSPSGYAIDFAWATSSWSTPWNGLSQGFRPIMEYKEV